MHCQSVKASGRTGSEPKATRTAEIVAEELGLRVETVEGLGEFDRPALPLVPFAEHERLNAAIFNDIGKVCIGKESGARALLRFTAGLAKALDAARKAETLVVVTHGTVISLLVAAHNDMDPLEIWKRLNCPSSVVLSLPGYRFVRLVNHADR